MKNLAIDKQVIRTTGEVLDQMFKTSLDILYLSNGERGGITTSRITARVPHLEMLI